MRRIPTRLRLDEATLAVLQGSTPGQVAAGLGVKAATVSRAAYQQGRIALARLFGQAARDQQRAARDRIDGQLEIGSGAMRFPTPSHTQGAADGRQ